MYHQLSNVNKLFSLNGCSLLYINYFSIKLIRKKIAAYFVFIKVAIMLYNFPKTLLP